MAWKSEQRFTKAIATSEPGCELITNLVPGAVYDVCVRSSDQCGESCIRKRMNPPPSPPVCTIGVCDKISLKCICGEETGDSVVKKYNIEVKDANSNTWVQYKECGRLGGDHLDCDISHEWLRENTKHVEEQSIVFRVSANNKYGWGDYSKDLVTKYLSKPYFSSAMTTSIDYRSVVWPNCGAGDCTYDVTIMNPKPERKVATGIKEMSYTIPSHFKDESYQYKISGSNLCGTTDFCNPVVPTPKFTEKCPTMVSMEPIYDSCIGHEHRNVKETFLECKDMDGTWTKVDSCVFGNAVEQMDCAIDEGKFMNVFTHIAGNAVTCRTAVSYDDPLKDGVVSRENTFFISNPLKEHL